MASSGGLRILLFILLVQVFSRTEAQEFLRSSFQGAQYSGLSFELEDPQRGPQYPGPYSPNPSLRPQYPGLYSPDPSPGPQNPGPHSPSFYPDPIPERPSFSEDDLTVLIGPDVQVPYPLYKQISESFLSTTEILVLLPNNTIVQVSGYAGLKDISKIDPEDTKVLISANAMIAAPIYLRIILIQPEEVMVQLPDGEVLPNQIYKERYGKKLETQEWGGQAYYKDVPAKDSVPFLMVNEHKRTQHGNPLSQFEEFTNRETSVSDLWEPSPPVIDQNHVSISQYPDFNQRPYPKPIPVPHYSKPESVPHCPESVSVSQYPDPNQMPYPGPIPVPHYSKPESVPHCPEPVSVSQYPDPNQMPYAEPIPIPHYSKPESVPHCPEPVSVSQYPDPNQMPYAEPIPIPHYSKPESVPHYPESVSVSHYSEPGPGPNVRTLRTLPRPFYAETKPATHYTGSPQVYYYPEAKPVPARPYPEHRNACQGHSPTTYVEPRRPASEQKALLPHGVHVMDTSRCNICDPASQGAHVRVFTV